MWFNKNMTNPDTQAVEQEAPDTQVADTAETQTSEASQSETTSPDATQENVEAKETSTPETNAEDTDEKLYAGKYKSAEDLKKAYSEIQSKVDAPPLDVDSMSPEELEKAYSWAQSRLGQQSNKQAQLSQQLNQSVTPAGADTATGNIPETIYRDTAVMKFVMSHPDANGEAMNEVLTSDPYISQINGYEARLEYAYAKAQGKTQAKAIEEAKKEATNQTHAKIAEKEVAKVESAKKAEPVDEDSELANKLKNGTPEEREKARKEIIRKRLVNL